MAGKSLALRPQWVRMMGQATKSVFRAKSHNYIAFVTNWAAVRDRRMGIPSSLIFLLVQYLDICTFQQ